MRKKIKWGILGTGKIANAFAKGVLESQTGQLSAVGSRTLSSAQNFAQTYDIPAFYGSYEELLQDSETEAIYISTPHPFHAEWAIKSAEAGKHILCEKPLTLNHAEAMAVAEAAQTNDVFLMEAFMYRCHPQTQKLIELIKSKIIGEIRLIQATFSFQTAFHPESRLFNNELGGGGILDVGCYAASMVRLIAGVAIGKPFADPISVKGTGHLIPETGVDGYATASLEFPENIIAQISSGVFLHQKNEVLIYGTEGHLHIPSPWFCSGPEKGSSTIYCHHNGKDKEENPKEIKIKSDAGLYAIEADTVAQSLFQNKKSSSAMPIEDTLGNMKTLDSWRHSIGLQYHSEKPNATIPTVHRRPLKKQNQAKMTYGEISGLSLPVSRLVMGIDNQRTLPHLSVMCDDFFEKGGNTFDTAHNYGRGLCENLLGQWIKQRRIRDQINLIVKGAHTPLCRPEFITQQLHKSLERLQTDYADIYFMHRDNLDIPVEEFVDVLNEHYQSGLIKKFGGSNWSIERLNAANSYAKSKGLKGFEIVSNNFSLAHMVNPVWSGCIAASAPEQKAWFEKTQTPLFCWSSQARGFFTERAGKNKKEDPELVKSWYSEDNFERRERAIILAQKKNVDPIHIALAYVLHQKFPTFALCGPRQLFETKSSLQALSVDLTSEEVRWLNLEDSQI